MSDIAKSYRIGNVAKELNVVVTKLIEYLVKKGFTIENKPTAKLTEDMYLVLLKEFNADAAAKHEAEMVDLNKGHNILLENKRKDEFITAPTKKVEEKPELVIKSSVVVTGPIIKGKIDLSKTNPPVATLTPTPAPTVVETPIVNKKIQQSITELINEPIADKTENAEKITRKKVTLDGPKVVGKLKKAEPKTTKIKKDEESQPEAAAPAPEPPVVKGPRVHAPFVPEELKATIQEVRFAQTPTGDITTNKIETKRVELTGPKILNKIDLSKFDEPKPTEKAKEDANKNHQRKRIKVAPTQRLRPIEDGNKPNVNRNNDAAKKPAFNKDKRKELTPEATEKEIQEKIKNTLAALSGTGQKSSKSKYRKEKRQLHADNAAAEADSIEGNMLNVTEFISVSELAGLMNKAPTDVIMACLSLGIMVSINQRLDAEIIEVVASEFGYKVTFISVEDEYAFDDDEDSEDDLATRAPIVTIMGHVDHGKTSLLDYIRNANVVAGEAGGITQHIGAYEVTLPAGQQITFLDTPGHEAFTAMRARGAKVTDIAVIVVSADDSVMPQTKEAISHAQAAEVPIIFAINKVDKDGANPERIKEQLAGMNLLVEDWGGKIQSQEVSAKKGLNIDKLLEKVLLEAEMLNLKANANKPGSGSVIEATLDKGRGYVATILVQDGTLKLGDMLVAGSQYGRIKAMYNERGGKVAIAGPSTPVQILGLDGAPQAGEKFKVFDDEAAAKELAIKRQQVIREQGYRTRKHITLDEIGRRLALGNFQQLNIIVKADVDGSVEALSDSLIKLSNTEIQVNVVHKAVGQISESDVLLATASDAIVIGFNVRPSIQARKLAENENIEVKLYSIIYDAIEELKGAIEGMMKPTTEEKIICNVEIREVFKITKVGTIAGCNVLDGKLMRNTKIRIIREGIVVYTGELASLKRFKDDAKEVTAGMDCGLNIKNFNDIKVNDIVEGYEEIEVKRKV
jgi:translation initiation factor IF-2